MDYSISLSQSFIYRRARPLDLARWRYHFEDGKQADVLHALAFYQNEDGGFGHALEPDSWNPHSTPIQTWAATEILREINWNDSSHPLIEGILAYLGSKSDFENGHWLNAPLSNNDYPAAIWWQRESDGVEDLGYNPTAALCGFILRHADPASPVYAMAHLLAVAAIEHFINSDLNPEMHICSCYIRLWEDLTTLDDVSAFHVDAFALKLDETISLSLASDPAAWATSYACKPSQFFTSPQSFGAAKHHELIQAELEFLRQTQLTDGSWPVNWIWHRDYPREETLSLNWWKADIIIKQGRFLQNFQESITEGGSSDVKP